MKNERNCDFMTVVSTGEKPNAEIHVIAFDDGNVQGRQEGNMRDLAILVADLVKEYAEQLKERQGLVPTAAFCVGVTKALFEGAGHEAMEMSLVMADPERMAKEITKVLNKLGDEIEGDDD